MSMDGENENINLSNGNVNVTIPLLHLKGRAGMDFNLAWQSDTKVYQFSTFSDPDGTSGPMVIYDTPSPGFGRGRLTLPTLAINIRPTGGFYYDQQGWDQTMCAWQYIFTDEEARGLR